MALIIDKRNLPKNTASTNRQKFIDRYKGAIKKRIREIVGDQSIKDFGKGDKKVKIKVDDLAEPSFEFEQGSGRTDRIYIGNKKFKKGDLVNKPKQQQGGSGGVGNGGGGEDDFEFVLTEKEFTDLFFEDLALPNLTKREFLGNSWEIKHAGFSRFGGPSSLNIKRTMLNAMARRIALTKKRKQEIEKLKDFFNQCDGCMARLPLNKNGLHIAKPPSGNFSCQKDKYSKPRIGDSKPKIQYIEELDLRYNFKDKVDVPNTRAVMFCLLDVSGSMGEKEKDIAKRFFILLNLFLKRNYTIVDVVFVRHAEFAEEIDEQRFFYERQSGGTIISSGYEKIHDIIKQRYNVEQWNVYIAQASDGDNFDFDNETMHEVLTQKLLPISQYFSYIDVSPYDRKSGVLKLMEQTMKTNKNLQARAVQDYSDIFPVFRSLFKKKEGE